MFSRDLLRFGRDSIASAVMFMAGGLVPVLGGILAMLAPAPILGASIGYRRSTWRAAAAVAIGAALVSLTAGFTAGLAYIAIVGCVAIAMCYLIEKRQPFDRIIAIVTVLLLVVAGGCVLLATGSPEALAVALRQELTTAMARGEKAYSSMGLDLAMSSDMRASIISTTLELAPALCAVSAATMVFFNLGIFWRFSGGQQRLGYPLFGDLVRWSTPEWLMWLLLATGFGLFIPNDAMRAIALNCFVCIASVYFFQGLAIMAFYFRVLSMPSLARGLVYALTIVQPVLAALICVAGIFDLWVDFRRLKTPGREARNLGDFS